MAHSFYIAFILILFVSKYHFLATESNSKKNVYIQVAQRDTIIEKAPIQLSRDQVLALANKKARQLNYDLTEMEITISKDAINWDSLVVQKPYFRLQSFEEHKKLLKNKTFWVIYYAPKPNNGNNVIVGGDLFIFISQHNGNILLTIRGK